MTHTIDGKAFASRLRDDIARRVGVIQSTHGLTPGLAVVLIGDDPASEVYVRNKGRQTRAVGMTSFEYRLSADVQQHAVLELVAELNAREDVHGILVQLPLPAQIDEATVLNAIDFRKDVDGFHLINVGLLAKGAEGVVPCTPLGCMMMLKAQLGDLSGRRAVVVGRSNIVGKPMAALLLKANCTVTVAHSRTRELPAVCRQADIVVAATGRPEMVKDHWIKPGATVIDVGINRIEEAGRTRLVGDVEFASVSKVAGAITPVPGGVGPMTVACLLHNTLQQACRLNGLPIPEPGHTGSTP